jgi:hypothetical protein
LQVHGTLYSIDGTAELDEYTVAGDLEDAAPMPGDEGLQHVLASDLERGERAGLVGLH